jgi:hypothetical protein
LATTPASAHSTAPVHEIALYRSGPLGQYHSAGDRTADDQHECPEEGLPDTAAQHTRGHKDRDEADEERGRDPADQQPEGRCDELAVEPATRASSALYQDERDDGGRGGDTVYGKDGGDYINGGRVSDKLFGGRGNDTIKAQDGYKDYIDCGPGDDTAYVDADLDTWANCENVRPSDGTPKGADAVFGTGRLGAEFGSPQLHFKAKSIGTSPIDAQGRFLIKYPDGTRVRGTILCLAVTGNEARLAGRIESASGPREANGTFERGEYVRIAVRDDGTNDQANFSPGEASFTSCNGENPNLDVAQGNFVVKDV